MIQVIVVLWFASLAAVGLGSWKISAEHAGKEFQEYRLAQQKLALEQERANAKLLEEAHAKIAEADAAVAAANTAAERALGNARVALERLDVAERNLRISAAAVRVFNANTSSGGQAGTSEARARVDAPPGGAEASGSTLGHLLETAAENNANHEKCVGQVTGLQKYVKALYTFCGGKDELDPVDNRHRGNASGTGVPDREVSGADEEVPRYAAAPEVK